MAVSTFDEQFLDDEQKEKLRALTEAWNRAKAAGDRAGMESAHAAAERIRATANYRGGDDGSQFLPFGSDGTAGSGGGEDPRGASGGGTWSADGASAGYIPYDLPAYRAQTQAVEELYDAARMKRLSELRSAFDRSVAALEEEKEAIPGVYQSGRNSAAAQSETAGRNFREYAAATGLASGAAGQAELARSNQLQSELGKLDAQESEAQRKVLRERTELWQKYASDVASALAEGELERARALLEELTRAEESRVATARAQADENYRAYGSRTDAARAEAERLSQERKAEDDRAAQEKKEAASESEAQEKTLRERAERLAGFGNFNGYLELGYSQDEVLKMRRAWISKNPLTAYYTGAIDRDEYLRLTGKSA